MSTIINKNPLLFVCAGNYHFVHSPQLFPVPLLVPWVLNFYSAALQFENVVIKDNSFPEFNLNPKSLHSSFNVICCIFRCTLEDIISDLKELKC